MKPQVYCLSLLVACGLSVDGHAGERLDPRLAARHLIADIEQSVLADQYRHVRMEMFKARLELQMTRLKMRHASHASVQQREKSEQALAVQEERVALLEETTARTREELIHVIMERVELEAQIDHPDDRHGGFEGTWSGRSRDGETIHLTIKGDHARLEGESGDEWFETEFHAEPRDDGLWNVALRVIECSDGDYQGKTSLGIAELGDGLLVMALAEPGTGARPASPDEGGGESKVFRLERD